MVILFLYFPLLFQLSSALFCQKSHDCPTSLTQTAYCLPHTSRCLQVPRNRLSIHQFKLPESVNFTTRSRLFQETNSKPLSLTHRKIILQKAALVLREINPHRFFHLNRLNVDPAKELMRLKRLVSIRNLTNIQFHEKVQDIFQRMDDFHTVYIRPEPLASSFALLGFSISEYYNTSENNVPRYVISDVLSGADFGAFKPGVEILTYNGLPIRQAIRKAGKQESASNPSAIDANGLLYLTSRFLIAEKIPSAKDSPKIVFRDLNGSLGNITFDWVYVQVIPEQMEESSRLLINYPPPENMKFHLPRRPLPDLGQLPRIIRLSENHTNIPVKGNLSESLEAEILKTSVGEIGRLWIQSFPQFSKDAVLEYTRVLKQMPKNGLILDLRKNGGGDPDLVKAVLELCSDIEFPPFLSNMRANDLAARLIFEDTPNITVDGISRDDLERFVSAYQPGMRTGRFNGERFTGPTSKGLLSFRVDERQSQAYKGPIVAVMDARTYSGGDMFASYVVDTGVCDLVGVANATGGGGASTVLYSTIAGLYPKILTPLPDVGVDFSTSFIRFYRTGNQSGFLVENFGVEPTIRYYPTYRDAMERDCDLYEFLGRHLMNKN